MIMEIDGNKLNEAVGNYVVLYKKDKGKYVAKVVSIDEDNALARYEIMSGEDKGSVKTGKYVKDRPYKTYDEESLVKALMEV